MCQNSASTTEGSLSNIGIDDDNHCESYLDVCCLEEHIDRAATSIPSNPVCGERNEDGVSFRPLGLNQNESIMAVLKQESGTLDRRKDVFLCGGSLIHPRVVLTAAHCVHLTSPDQLMVRGGEWDPETKNEIYEHQDRAVSEVVTHPEFSKEFLHSDIALLFLDSPLELDEIVQTVCLPPQDTQFDHQSCIATGWEQGVSGDLGKYQGIPKQITLGMIPLEQCQSSLRRGVLVGPEFTLHKSFVCAGGEKGIDTCTVDGGSPLVCPVPGSHRRFYQAGIVAFSVGCGEEVTTGLYANVASFRSWIDQEMGSRKLDTGSYTA